MGYSAVAIADRVGHESINITYNYMYTELQITGKLNGYLADLNEQAEAMFLELVKQMAVREGITERLKTRNQMLWVRRMNNIRDQAVEVVNNDLIFN